MRTKKIARPQGRPPREEYRKMSATIDVPLYDMIVKEADRLKTNRSTLIERILEEYLFGENAERFLSYKAKLCLIRNVVGDADDGRVWELVKSYLERTDGDDGNDRDDDEE